VVEKKYKPEEYIGKKFNRLLILSNDSSRKYNFVFCKCDCGVEKSIPLEFIIKGMVKSCGCWKKEEWIERNTKYRNGELDDGRFCGILGGIKNRCKSKRYVGYHGRGISVCDRWTDKENGLRNFIEDMKESYDKHCEEFGTSNTLIERIDNDGNYEPSNCKWSTFKEQLRNTRRNRKFIATRSDGVEFIQNVINDFAKEHNLSGDMISHILRGKSKSGLHKGWKFRYYEEIT